MKVKATLNHGHQDYPNFNRPLMQGESRIVPDDIGAVMVSRGHAIRLPDDPPEPAVQAVPAASESVSRHAPRAAKV